MGNLYDTQIGGFQNRFSTTRWSMIINSQHSDEEYKRMILDVLFQKYWKPVYWYIRRKGYDNEKAKDLTQGFFAEIVWGRDLIQSANPEKGRFRSFLLTALDRYLADTYRHEHSQKRMPSKEIFSYDADDTYELAGIEKQDEFDAQEAFNSIWLLDLLQQSLAEVQKDMEEDGMGKYWVLFERHCIEPILKSTKPPVLKETCKTLNIKDPAKASNMIITVKRRVKKTVIQNVQKMEGSNSNLDEEISALIGKILI